MPSLNVIHLIGNIGKEPELRYTPSGTPVISFSLAVSTGYLKDGEWKDETNWFKIIIFGKRAETINDKWHKGDCVYCSGELKIRQYTTNDGVKGTSVEVTANQSKMIQSKNKDTSNNESQDEQPPIDDTFPSDLTEPQI